MPFLVKFRWLEHSYAIFLTIVLTTLYAVAVPVIIQSALLASICLFYLLLNRWRVETKSIYLMSIFSTPLVLGSIFSHIGTRPLLKTIGAIVFLILLIFSAFAIKNFKFPKSLIILFSKYQTLLISLCIVLYIRRIPGFYLIERGAPRLSNYLGDPNFFAANTALVCFLIAIFLKQKYYENKILYIISIIAIFCAGSASMIGFILFSSIIVYFPTLINISKKAFFFLILLITNFLNMKAKIFLRIILITFSLIFIFIIARNFYSVDIIGRPYKVINYIIENKTVLYDFNFLNKLSSGRLELSRFGLEFYYNYPFLNKIFGAGVTEYLSVSRYPHNTYVEVLLEGGFILFIVFMMTNVLFYISVIKTNQISKMAKIFGISSNLAFLSLTLMYKVLPIWSLILAPVLLSINNTKAINKSKYVK